MRLSKYILLGLLIVSFISCKSFMTTEPDSSLSTEYALSSRDYFKGILYKTYEGLPTRISFDYEAATDNAVVNDQSLVSSTAARGGLSAINNPFGDNWQTDYLQINRVNWYLEHLVLNPSNPVPTPVRFDLDPKINMQLFYFTKGEAYFLRAWYMFDLLLNYGGVATDGIAYGFPISTKYLEYTDNLDLPRNTYLKCVEQIAADCDSAAKYLPLTYSKTSGTTLDGLTSDAGHASGLAALSLKSKAYLYAASPAYNPGNDLLLWDKAAKAASTAINAAGNVDLLAYTTYFNKNNLNNANFTNTDIFFRGRIQANNTALEQENYPPLAFGGLGRFNPTQNLVDAFPMKDGYPIGASSATNPYNPANMFLNRDPRLDLFIVRDGEIFAKDTLNTKPGGKDAFGSNVNATRTGYYLQKLLDGTVSLEKGKVVSTTRALILLGRPELYLNFAEAAINATGNPDDIKYGFSARSILAKVRIRALGAGNDKYLATITGKDNFIKLVKNERRIELCFENHRFWDLRRWSTGATDKTLINTPAYGIYLTGTPVETRSFASPYMPLPFSEIIKTQNLVNNAGW